MAFFDKFLPKFKQAKEEDLKTREEVIDEDAVGLSYIAKAAYQVLRTEHSEQHMSLWDVTSGKVVDSIKHTPNHVSFITDAENFDPSAKHSDWLAHEMGELLSRTEVWADVTSLAPPDGLFLEEIQKAISKIAVRAHMKKTTVVIRMMFGNIVGMPVDCNALLKSLTASIPSECEDNINMWVGAWRKGLSWNHSKIIAVDGVYLLTGGHNLWDYHYLKDSPIHDVSIELKGPVAHDGHLFANDQWEFVESVQSSALGSFMAKLPDNFRLTARARVAVSEYPAGVGTFPPAFFRGKVAMRVKREQEKDDDYKGVPIITMGRYGTLVKQDRPADDAFIAMFNAAKKVIHLALQDLGPVCVPMTKVALPGTCWPKEYLKAIGKAMWQRGVDVEIILSNPGSIPGGLSMTEANYGNGWSCVDVAAEIIKCVKAEFPMANDEQLEKKINDNLRVCFIRRSTQHKNKWRTGMNIGLHAKFFIIDNQVCYIGSQNLYVCDLAEWGVVIDHAESVQKIMADYWTPMWKASYTGKDVNVGEVMKGLAINRDGEDVSNNPIEMLKHQTNAVLRQAGIGSKRHGAFCKDHDSDED